MKNKCGNGENGSFRDNEFGRDILSVIRTFYAKPTPTSHVLTGSEVIANLYHTYPSEVRTYMNVDWMTEWLNTVVVVVVCILTWRFISSVQICADREKRYVMFLCTDKRYIPVAHDEGENYCRIKRGITTPLARTRDSITKKKKRTSTLSTLRSNQWANIDWPELEVAN